MTEINVTKKSYDEMLAEAQSIHPDMKLRVTGQNKDEWEMFLPTNNIQPQVLSDRFKDTKAWELLNTPYPGFDNALESYRRRKKLDGVPLDGVAEHINLYEDQQNWGGPVKARLHAASGTDFDWAGEVSNDQFSAYQKTQRKVADIINAEFKDKWDALREKWRY
jgi:hypothetical protein